MGIRAVAEAVLVAGYVLGLFVWRWLAALAAFAIAWGTVRRLRARGLSVVVVTVACAMVYRQRTAAARDAGGDSARARAVDPRDPAPGRGPDRAWWTWRSRASGPKCT